MAAQFGVSTELANQTVTAYMVVQGVSPLLWGSLSDRFGRRPVFLVCMVVLIGACVGLALCPADAFWLLLVLRCLQAAGCASTIALGAGVVGDISTPEERAGFFGAFNIGPMAAPCIGPAVGGALAQHLGWRALFWFLVIMAAACLAGLLLVLPETLRALVGNGSIEPATGASRLRALAYRPLLPVVGRRAAKRPATAADRAAARRVPIQPFRLLTYPDVLLSLLFTGLVYAINYTITATISSSFAVAYPFLSETAIGLCYLPTGGGMIVGSTVTGSVLDREYSRVQRDWVVARGRDPQGIDFPKEYARLRLMPLLVAVFAACVFAWGFCIQYRAPLAVPLVLQFVLGATSISILNTTMTLLIDILQRQSSAATACTNFVRCLLGALFVGLIDRMTSSPLQYRFTYVFWGAVSTLMLPLMLLEIRVGSRWRIARDRRMAKAE